MVPVSLTVFLNGFLWPLSAVSFSDFCFLPKMKMKVKKENNRFNVETVCGKLSFWYLEYRYS